MSCLAVITARGGSKGVPNKNIRPIGGRPLLDYSIEVGKRCKHVSRTVVTTDSEAIKDVAVRAGADVPFLRPAELATDTATQEDTIVHAMDFYEKQGERYDYVCLIQPTAPLRQVASLDRGFELLAANPDAESVFSVTECEFSPLYVNTLRPDGYLRDWMDEKYKTAQRQEIPVFYRLNALVTISRWEAFRKNRSFLHDRAMHLVVDRVEASDIDEPVDFFVVKQLLEAGFHHSGQLREWVVTTS